MLCDSIFLVIALAGCQNDEELAYSPTSKIKKNTMVSVDLTTRESYIIDLLNQHKVFVSEYRVSDKFKEVHVLMKEFQNGKLVETTGLGGLAAGKTGSIIIAIDKSGNLIHYIESDGSRVVYNEYPHRLEFPIEFGKGMISWLSPESSYITDDKPVVIATIRYNDPSSDTEIMYSISCEFSTEWTSID